jgi:hypothetical protein
MKTGNGWKRERLDRKKKSGFESATTKALVDMKIENARQIVDAGMLTYAELRNVLDNGKSADASKFCYFFTVDQVRELIRAAINGKRGRIQPQTIWALYALWGLVEFG